MPLAWAFNPDGQPHRLVSLPKKHAEDLSGKGDTSARRTSKQKTQKEQKLSAQRDENHLSISGWDLQTVHPKMDTPAITSSTTYGEAR